MEHLKIRNRSLNVVFYDTRAVTSQARKSLPKTSLCSFLTLKLNLS